MHLKKRAKHSEIWCSFLSICMFLSCFLLLARVLFFFYFVVIATTTRCDWFIFINATLELQDAVIGFWNWVRVLFLIVVRFLKLEHIQISDLGNIYLEAKILKFEYFLVKNTVENFENIIWVKIHEWCHCNCKPNHPPFWAITSTWRLSQTASLLSSPIYSHLHSAT